MERLHPEVRQSSELTAIPFYLHDSKQRSNIESQSRSTRLAVSTTMLRWCCGHPCCHSFSVSPYLHLRKRERASMQCNPVSEDRCKRSRVADIERRCSRPLLLRGQNSAVCSEAVFDTRFEREELYLETVLLRLFSNAQFSPGVGPGLRAELTLGL
jgi:hypothetical protein